eukprot:m.9975 g.9975  ORF g.9975 m.9975 type:complete len:145 (+) comp21785_c0_seq1:90-524(+)
MQVTYGSLIRENIDHETFKQCKIVGEGFTIHVPRTEVMTKMGEGPYDTFYFGICKVSSIANDCDASITVVIDSANENKPSLTFSIGSVSKTKFSLVDKLNPQKDFLLTMAIPSAALLIPTPMTLTLFIITKLDYLFFQLLQKLA